MGSGRPDCACADCPVRQYRCSRRVACHLNAVRAQVQSNSPTSSPRGMAPPYHPVIRAARPAEGYEAWVPVGATPVRSENYKAFLIREGVAELHGEFGVHVATAGELVIVRPGVICGSLSQSPVELVTAYLHPSFVVDQLRWKFATPSDARTTDRELARVMPMTRAIRPTREQLDGLVEQFDRLVYLTAHDAEPGERLAGAAGLVWRVREAIESVDPTTVVTNSEDREALRPEVRTVLRVLHDDYRAPWTMSQLSHLASLSESALRRAFESAMGMSPHEYLHYVRLARFEDLVAHSAMSIAEATLRVGWSSPGYARRIFVRDHGIPPSEHDGTLGDELLALGAAPDTCARPSTSPARRTSATASAPPAGTASGPRSKTRSCCSARPDPGKAQESSST